MLRIVDPHWRAPYQKEEEEKQNKDEAEAAQRMAEDTQLTTIADPQTTMEDAIVDFSN